MKTKFDSAKSSTEPRNGIGHRIMILRRSRGLSQKEVAKKAGLNPSQVSRIETGDVRNPRYNTIERIVVQGMGCKMTEIEVGKESMDTV